MDLVEMHTVEDGHAKVMFHAAGIQFRSNIVRNAGGTVSLHAHSYDHVAMITHGWFAVVEITEAGEERRYTVASKGFRPFDTRQPFTPVGYRVLIPARHQHSFTLIEARPDLPGEVLCMWASDGSEAHEGC